MTFKLGMKAVLVGLAATFLFLASAATASFPIGKWHPAHATYYGGDNGNDGTMGGACSYGDMWANFFGVHTAALSDVLFQNGLRCGACYELKCIDDGHGWCYPGRSTSVVVTATNNCPLGSFGGWCDAPRQHFDLAVPAFARIAQKVAGVVPIHYRRVPCQKQGGMRFLIKGNPYFQLVLIYNVGGAGDVESVAIKGDSNTWLPMKRNWGENWQFGGYLVGQALSIAVTTFDGAKVISHNVANRFWEYGQTFEGSQFY